MPEDPCQHLADELADLIEELARADETTEALNRRRPRATGTERAQLRARLGALPGLIRQKRAELAGCRADGLPAPPPPAAAPPAPHAPDPCQQIVDEIASLTDELAEEDPGDFADQSDPHPTGTEIGQHTQRLRHLRPLIEEKKTELAECRAGWRPPEPLPPPPPQAPCKPAVAVPKPDPCRRIAEDLAALQSQAKHAEEDPGDFADQSDPHPTGTEIGQHTQRLRHLRQLIEEKKTELAECRAGRRVPPQPRPDIEHVFVIAFENRSFDHMLGFAAIAGTDADTYALTTIENLAAGYSIDFQGYKLPATNPAHFVMRHDPLHEFKDVREQLCGTGNTYINGINNNGFVESYRNSAGSDYAEDPGEIMKCFSIQQLPVLTALACEFVVCDHWFSSVPGPTWPNRFFLQAATSGGLSGSPSWDRILLAIGGDDLLHALFPLLDPFGIIRNEFKYHFENGTIYDRLSDAGKDWAIYKGDEFPVCMAIAGVDGSHISDFEDFARDLQDPNFSPAYVFIEPNYGHTILHGGDMKCGNSQHPTDDVTRGERLLKDVYEAIRNSPHWEKSLLVVTYDEHGGFYDHVPPPRTFAPGDGSVDDDDGFDFTQLGVRVPTLLISPLIPKNMIDKTIYDHVSLLATVERLFGLQPLTQRDRQAKDFLKLFTLDRPRRDTPAALPNPADSGIDVCNDDNGNVRTATARSPLSPKQVRDAMCCMPSDPVSGNAVGFAQIALQRDLQLSPPHLRDRCLGRFLSIRTNADAALYMHEVRTKIAAAKADPDRLMVPQKPREHFGHRKISQDKKTLRRPGRKR